MRASLSSAQRPITGSNTGATRTISPVGETQRPRKSSAFSKAPLGPQRVQLHTFEIPVLLL
jgi:hypothetical protein